MSNIIATTPEGVEITKEMATAFAERYGFADVESNYAGTIGTLSKWCRGVGELDAFLCDSPEKRELFAGVRKAYFAALGREEPAYSAVSWEDRPEVGE